MKRFRIGALGLMLALFATLGTAGAASASTASVGSATAHSASMVTPNIESQSCTGSNLTWVRVDSTFHGNICYGFVGTATVNVYAYEVCSGNNSGSVTFTLPGGTPQTHPLGPGIIYSFASNRTYINSITIRSWSGGDVC